MIKHATQTLWFIQLSPKGDACRQLCWSEYIWGGGSCFLLHGCIMLNLHLRDVWLIFNNKLNLLVSLDAFLFQSVLYSGHDEGEDDKTLLCLMSIGVSPRLRREEAGGPAGAAESSCWRRGRRGVESVSELAGWHSYHGTNSLGTEEKLQQNCGEREGRSRRRLGQCGACCVRVPVPRPCPRTQTARESACHQGHTDGSLLGACGC